MKNYQFTIEIPAETEIEAETKLELLMEVAAFLKTFDLTKLSSTFLYYMLLVLAGKCSQKLSNPSRQGQRKYTRVTK